MGRLIILVGFCLVILGTLITFKVPMTWIGHLPGDFSMKLGSTYIFIPITTSLIFSFILTIILSLFARR